MTGLPLNIDIQQILLHAVNLVILIGGLYIILYKPVKDFMDKRVQHYKDIDEQADKLIAESLEKKQMYEEKLSNADDEIAKLKNDAAAKSREAAAKELEEAKADAEKIRVNARVLAENEKEKILLDAKREVADLAAQAAAKIIDGEDEYASFLNVVDK